MTEATVVLTWAQIVALGASLPLAAIAAWGYRTAPVGRAVAALPLISLGFLLAASDKLLLVSLGEWVTLWHVGTAIGTLGMAWVAISFLDLVSGRRQIGR